MHDTLEQDKTFDNIDYSEKDLSKREFVNCTFTNCNFSKCKLSSTDFIDCNFQNCNFSLALLKQTGLKNIGFTNCKMVGIDFSVTNDFLFSVNFAHCIIDYSTFFKKKMKKTIFKHSSLKDVDFGDTDLSMAIFDNCDLLNTAFTASNLEKADFRTAKNYIIDPEKNKMKNARFSYTGLAGLLSKYDLNID